MSEGDYLQSHMGRGMQEEFSYGQPADSPTNVTGADVGMGANTNQWYSPQPYGENPVYNIQQPPPVAAQSFSAEYESDYENEPPLIEELGINIEHIWTKTQAVLKPTMEIHSDIMDDTDLAGPVMFCLCLGVCLLLAGKLQFGYVYGFGVFGCISMNLVLNLMSQNPIDFWKVCSVLGYCMIPTVGLATLAIVVSLKGVIGLVLGIVVVCWSTHTATRLFEKSLGMYEQRWLIAYPIGLLYSCFVLITVF